MHRFNHPILLCRRAVICLSLLTIWTAVAAANSMICGKEYIQDLKSYVAIAHSFIGDDTTTDPNHISLYITPLVPSDNGGGFTLYIQSNYRRPDVDGGLMYPTKIATSDSVDLPLLLANIVEQGATPPDVDGVKYFIDQSFFVNPPTNAHLDFDDGQSVNVIGPDGAVRRTFKRDQSDGDSDRLVVFGDHTFTRVTVPEDTSAIQDFANSPLNKGNIHLLNLVMHGATEAEIGNRPATNPVPFNLALLSAEHHDNAIAQLDEALHAIPNSMLFVLSHITDSGVCEVIDPGGDVVLSLPVQNLYHMTDKYGITLFLLGCNSGKFGPRGTAHPIDSVDAVKRFASAMEQATTVGSLFMGISSETLELIVDSAAVDGARIRIKFDVVRQDQRTEVAGHAYASRPAAPYSPPPGGPPPGNPPGGGTTPPSNSANGTGSNASTSNSGSGNNASGVLSPTTTLSPSPSPSPSPTDADRPSTGTQSHELNPVVIGICAVTLTVFVVLIIRSRRSRK